MLPIARLRGCKVNFAPGKLPLRGNSCRKYIYRLPAQVRAKHCEKFVLTSVERRCCSNEAKTRKPLKLAGVPQTNEAIRALVVKI